MNIHFSSRCTQCILLVLFFLPNLTANTPFNKGVNLSAWFQANSTGEIIFRKYTKQDFIEIQSLGADVIRLPINMEGMTNGAPNYTFDPNFLCMLDEVVTWAEDLGIKLILDNHTFADFTNTSVLEDMLKKMWNQMATRYESTSTLIYYEIQNEPHDITDAAWNAIQQAVIDEIRTVDTKHSLIIGGAGFNGLWNLDQMPIYTDPNLIYTFHFYEPFLFTHQGATWVTPSLDLLSDMPFPYVEANMPTLDPFYTGTWIESAYNGYSTAGTVANIQSLLDIVDNFQSTRNVPVYCGEFGVYIPNSDDSERVYWYEQTRQNLESRAIPWTIWDYRGGFGLFEANTNELFEHDVNIPLVNALGLNAPAQTPFSIQPDEEGLLIYDDYLGVRIGNSSYGAGTRDFTHTTQPEAGKFCIQWNNAPQYTTTSFDFAPNRDFSQLVADGFALEFDVRSSVANTSFQVRFEDTDTGASDRPWRMSTNIDATIASWNGEWQHVRIPLSDFLETGAYEGTYYPPAGLFDWTAIDHLRIVAEFGTLTAISFDNIEITANISLSPKVILQGAYDGVDMDMALNSMLPNTHPYTTEHSGTESVTTIPNTNIVDWVLVELRYPADVVQASRAAFLRNDGTVVDLDGSSPISFEGLKRLDYYVAIRHRNHLGVMTDNLVNFIAN